MRVLILGSTGLLGPSLMAEAAGRGMVPIGAARADADVALDITDLNALEATLIRINPDMVINAAALTDIARCEAEPGHAWNVNARPATVLADWSMRTGRPMMFVSTDHFFNEGGPHNEFAPISLVNEYARTKRAAESFTMQAQLGLVLRTNIVGARKGFGRWAIQSIESGAPMVGFADHVTSPLHVDAFSKAAFDLVDRKARGLLNVGARDACSKFEFIARLADALGTNVRLAAGTVAQQAPKRARACALSSSAAETILGRAFPTIGETLVSMVEEHRAVATELLRQTA
jgi:dTDP-4-dehydrorhamnose reductase